MNTENDPTHTDSTDLEDRAILAALDALETGELSAADTADETYSRLYVELLGLLPASLEPVVPADRVWQRLAANLDSAAGESTPTVAFPMLSSTAAPLAPAAVPTSAAPLAQVSSIARPAAKVASPSSSPSSGPALARSASRRSSRWPLALAAALALALAGLSLYLLRNLEVQTDQVASLYVKLAAAERQVADLHQAKGHLAEMEEKYSLVTNPGVSINRLAASGGQPAAPGASGILFVAADHNHWVLCLDGLPPADSGKGYQLWFMSESTAVSGGTFTARPGEVVELSAAEMPAGTRAVVVTLEPAAGSPLPSGPQVLATVG